MPQDESPKERTDYSSNGQALKPMVEVPPTQTDEVNLKPSIPSSIEVRNDLDEARLASAKLRTARWDHYIGFFTLKAAGLTALVTAAAELFAPDLIVAGIDPLSAGSVGLALLTGKSVLGLIAKATADEKREYR